jgi:hypothetical protein
VFHNNWGYFIIDILTLFFDVRGWNFYYIYVRLRTFISENLSSLARTSGKMEQQHWKHTFPKRIMHIFTWVANQKNESAQKTFFVSDFVELFLLIILIKNFSNFIEKWWCYSQEIHYENSSCESFLIGISYSTFNRNLFISIWETE